jgi:hypothetical protein
MMYQFWKHNQSGETFAVALTDHDKPVATCGPLPHNEVRDADGKLTNPADFNFDDGWDSEGDTPDNYHLVE